MPEINVELVRYNTKKTKKRKRANFIVASQTEAAIIERLERIHKGDKVESILEIKWGETIDNDEDEAEIYTGIVKFYDIEKGFGFIEPDEDMEDLFFHASALGGQEIYDNDPVDFEVSIGPKGPIAIRIQFIED